MPNYQNGYTAHRTAQIKSLIGKDACNFRVGRLSFKQNPT